MKPRKGKDPAHLARYGTRAPASADNPVPAPRLVSPFQQPLRGPRSAYTPEIAEHICFELMKGRALHTVCKDPDMPQMNTVLKWLANKNMLEFHQMYYMARRVAAEMKVDQLWDVVATNKSDWEPIRDKETGEIIDLKPNNDTVQRSKLKADTIKWYASKLVPKIYGDSIDVELGATGGLAELLAKANNQSSGLPDPVDE